MSRYLYVGALFFSACSLSLSSRYAGPAPQWTIVGSPTACATAASGFFLSTDAIVALLKGNRIDSFEVVLDNGLRRVTTSALYIADARTFRVEVPAGLETGAWDVVLRPKGLAETTLPRAIDILEAPVLDTVSDRAICSTSTGDSAFVVRGQRLYATTVVSLDGLASAELTTSLREDGGLDVIVSAGALEKGRVYPIVVSNAGGCDARFEDGVVVVDPPVPTGFVAGPVLRDGTTIPLGAPFSLRVSGEHVVTGSAFSIGGVQALRTRAGPTADTVDADFAALPTGGHALTVSNGTCVAPVPGVVTIAGALPIAFLASNPSTVSSAGSHYLDVTTTLSAAVAGSAAPSFFIDADPDPFVADWHALPIELDLDGDRRLWRLTTPLFGLAKDAFLDVRAEAQSAANAAELVEGYWAGGVFALSATELGLAAATTSEAIDIAANATMRLLWKDRDHAMAGEHVTVYGCFGGAVSAELVAMDAPLGALATPASALLTVNGNVEAEAWARGKWHCLHDAASPVTRMLDVEVPPSVAPGSYRIRVRDVRHTEGDLGDVAQVADDLYPFVVYGATPELSAFEFAENVAGNPLVLTTGRKMAASVVAGEGSGRKYVYVVGGGSVMAGDPSSAPQTAENAEDTYEVSPISSMHTLLGFASHVLTYDGTVLSDPKATYGTLALADGPTVYLVGGTSNGVLANTTSEVRRASVIDAMESATDAGQLGTFSLAGELKIGSTKVKSFGHSGAILRTGDFPTFTRSAVVLRGIEEAATRYIEQEVVLAGDVSAASGLGNLQVVTAIDTVARGEAFGAAVQTAPDNLAVFLGYAAPADDTLPVASMIDADNNRFHSSQSIFFDSNGVVRTETALSGVVDSVAGATVPIAIPETGVHALHVGESLFLLGGIRAAYNNGGSPDDAFEFTELKLGDLAEPASRVRTMQGGVVSTAPVQTLTRRAYGAAVLLAPHAFIVSGLACKADESGTPGGLCDEAALRGLSLRAEHTTLH